MAKTPTHRSASKKSVEALTHEKAKRKNIPTAEYQSVLQKTEQDIWFPCAKNRTDQMN